jgi:hypothetical protein
LRDARTTNHGCGVLVKAGRSLSGDEHLGKRGRIIPAAARGVNAGSRNWEAAGGEVHSGTEATDR